MNLNEPYAPLAPMHIYIVNRGAVSPDPGLCPRDAQDLYALRYPVTSRQSNMLVYLATFYGLVFLDSHFIGNDLSWNGLLISPSRLVELLEVHYCLDETKFLERQEEIKREERSVPIPQMGSSSGSNKSSSSSSRPVSMPPPPPQHSSSEPSRSSMPAPPLPQPPKPAQQAYHAIMPPPLSPTQQQQQEQHRLQQQQQEQHRRQQQQQAAQFAMSMPPPPPPQQLPPHYPSTIPSPSQSHSFSMPPPPPVVSASYASVSAPIPKMSPSQKRRREDEGREAHERAVRRKSIPNPPEPVFQFRTHAEANALYPETAVTPPPSLKALGKRPEQRAPQVAIPGPSQPTAFGPAVSPVAWPVPPMAGSPPSAWQNQQPSNYNSSPYHRKP